MLADKLTIIVVTYNSMNVLPSFFQHLKNALDGEQCPILVCDNCSQDSVEDFLKKYRKGGNFPVLIENIRGLVQEKRKRCLKTPFIKIQFIITKHTEKELDLAVKLAKDLKVDGISFIIVSLGTHQTDEKTRKKLAKEYLPHDLSFSRYNIDKEERVINKWKYNYCPH